jgi:hypothetical protein
MSLKLLSVILMLFCCTFVPLKAGATVYQSVSNQASNVSLNQNFSGKKKLNFKKKIALLILKKQISKQQMSNENVKKRVDGFAIASIALAFSILISPNLGMAVLLLVLSLASSLISIIRISQKPKERGGIAFAILGGLISIVLLLAIKNSF